jgi:hypothetical protein
MASHCHDNDESVSCEQQQQRQRYAHYTDHSVEAILFAPRNSGPPTASERRSLCQQLTSLAGSSSATLLDTDACSHETMSRVDELSLCSPFLTLKSSALRQGFGDTVETPHAELELKTLWNQLTEVGGAEMVITKSGRSVVGNCRICIIARVINEHYVVSCTVVDYWFPSPKDG